MQAWSHIVTGCEQVSPAEGLKRLNKFTAIFKELEKKYNHFRMGEELFGLPRREYAGLMKTQMELAHLDRLYGLHVDMNEAFRVFRGTLWVSGVWRGLLIGC